ncbi:unnamed protein product [Sphacelaria rigidula]
MPSPKTCAAPALASPAGPASGNNKPWATAASDGLAKILQEHFEGLHQMKLGNIACTQMVRAVSDAGVHTVVDSIRTTGWLDQFAPSIVIPREAVRDGEPLTAEIMRETKGRVLDGYHRVTALKEEFGDEDMFLIRVYREFADRTQEKIIANSFNDATESVLERSIYDRIYFQNELHKTVMDQTGKRDVSIAALQKMYEKVGLVAPPRTTVRN